MTWNTVSQNAQRLYSDYEIQWRKLYAGGGSGSNGSGSGGRDKRTAVDGGKARGARAYTVPSGIDPSIITRRVECICDSGFCTLPRNGISLSDRTLFLGGLQGIGPFEFRIRGRLRSDNAYGQWSELAMIPTLPCTMEAPLVVRTSAARVKVMWCPAATPAYGALVKHELYVRYDQKDRFDNAGTRK